MPDMPYGEKLPLACSAKADNSTAGQLCSLPHAEKVRGQHKSLCFDGPSHPPNPHGKSSPGRPRGTTHRQFDVPHQTSPTTGRQTAPAEPFTGRLAIEPGVT